MLAYKATGDDLRREGVALWMLCVHSNNDRLPSISNVTSIDRGAAIYCASKGAISNMVRAVATEVAVDGVRVNAGDE